MEISEAAPARADDRSTEASRGGWSRRALGISGTLLLVSALAIAPAVALAANTAVDVGSAEAAPGETVTVPVILESAPDGLARYNLTVSVSDTDVATIDGGQYPSDIGNPEYPDVADDGSAVTLEAADPGRNIEAGATDVVLAKIRLTGQAGGEATLSLTVDTLTDDDGAAIAHDTTAGTLTVGGDGSDATEDDSDDGTENEPTSPDDGTATDSGATEGASETDREGERTSAGQAPEAATETDADRDDTTAKSGAAPTDDGDATRDESTENSKTGTAAEGETRTEGPLDGAVTISFDELDGPTIGLVVGLLLPIVVLALAFVVIVR